MDAVIVTVSAMVAIMPIMVINFNTIAITSLIISVFSSFLIGPIMIIVIMLLAGITITQGSDLIKNTKVETYLTNMITIRSKAKVYAEETNAEVWDAEDKTSKREEIYSEKYKLRREQNG